MSKVTEEIIDIITKKTLNGELKWNCDSLFFMSETVFAGKKLSFYNGSLFIENNIIPLYEGKLMDFFRNLIEQAKLEKDKQFNKRLENFLKEIKNA